MKLIKLVGLILLGISSVFADGLMVPVNDDYPKDFLKNRLTRVQVDINSVVAVTRVTQEFVNESNTTTDAVYSFPLPPTARATEFLYWYNDEVYQAVLKVREQATNPGTGEGGIIAEVNDYIGRNGIKIALKDIKPGAIQKIRLSYIQHCDYYQGKVQYQYPLDTGNFVTLPLEHIQFTVNVNANAAITNFASASHPDFNVTRQQENAMSAEFLYQKSYLDRDFTLSFQLDDDDTTVDFYSVANDSIDGHFALFLRPALAEQDSVFSKRVIFLLENSYNMSGYVWEQSIRTITHCLDLLDDNDMFNIVVFNYSTNTWKSSPVSVTAAHVQEAKNYLNSLGYQSGSNLDDGLQTALGQIMDGLYANSIIAYTTGYSYIDPRDIESANTFKAGIFPIAMGENIQRERLEMTAALNYGFVTYFDQDDNLYEGMTRVFEKLSRPVLQDVVFEFGRSDLHDLLPAKIPTAYSGSIFFLTGRYNNAGNSSLALAGTSVNGTASYGFQLDFTQNTEHNKFAESLWAREKIDALEQEIEIYGETSSLKQELIDISLRYNIRCRYTAYIADYETHATRVDATGAGGVTVPTSHLVGNYPNPFNPSTTIRFYLSPQSVGVSVKIIRIFNALGQLVAVIDISHMDPGMHEIRFNGQDFSGNALPSGTYFVFLQVGEQISSTRITLLK